MGRNPFGEEFHRWFEQPFGNAAIPKVRMYGQRSKKTHAAPIGPAAGATGFAPYGVFEFI